MSDTPGWDRQTFMHPRPVAGEKAFGWVQWKGTDVCADIHCLCGVMSHIDAEFAYYVQCPSCRRIYFLNGHIELVELTHEESQSVQEDLRLTVASE